MSGLFTRSATAALAFALATPAFAQPPADAAADAAADEGDAIIVTGARQALRDAISEKLAAPNTVETLYANDVGKLPDQNVAEAIKRLPGLSVANDQGEGRYVIIRGIDPSLVNVALNGQTLPAPEPGARQVKLDDIPSAMIQAITVTKSLLPDQDANAIGGEVNIRTKTAFDEKKAGFINARASAGVYDLNGKNPYELDAMIGGRLTDTLGIVVSANYSRRPIESQNFQGTTTYTTTAGGVRVPDTVGLRDYNLLRERMGIVGNLDWRPSDGVKVYLRSSYSKFSDNESRDQNVLDSFSNLTAGSGNYTARGSVLMRRRKEDDNTKSVTLGGDFEVGTGKLEVSGGWTRAVKIDPLRSEFRFRSGSTAVSGTYDLSGQVPYFSNFAGSNLAAYTFNSLNIETRQAAETIWQGRADFTQPIGIGDDSSIKVGVKYLDRHKTNNQDRTNYGTTSGASGSSSFQLASVAYTGNTSFYDGSYAFGPRIDYWAARGVIDARPGVSSVTAASSISASLTNDSDVKERIWAGYAMATVRLGSFTLIPGVRVEHTEDDLSAKVVSGVAKLTDPYNSFGHNSYTNVFPGLNAKWEPIRNLVWRGGVTTAIGRPNYASLIPNVVVGDVVGGVQQLSTGNPGLKPYKALNFDTSVEYYPNADSLFSAGFFHKEIDNPIYTLGQRLTPATFGGITYAQADVTQPINADKETLTGVEFNVQTQFTFLPGILSGLGVSANYTHVWGHASAANVRAGNIPLAFQSKNVGNVQIFYEKYGITARAAFNYRSSYLDTLGAGTAASPDQYTDGNGQLDIHIGYQVTEQVTVFGDAANLTDAPWRRFANSPAYLIERERYGPAFRGGVQVHF